MKYDYHHVSPEHADIHARLVNWALWADPRQRSMIAPMFRLYKSKARQWHAPDVKPALDTLDAIKLEQAVRESKESGLALAERLGCSPQTISRIRNHRDAAFQPVGGMFTGLMARAA